MAETFAEAAASMSPEQMQSEVLDLYTERLNVAETQEQVRDSSKLFVLHTRILRLVVDGKLDKTDASKQVWTKCQQGYLDK